MRRALAVELEHERRSSYHPGNQRKPDQRGSGRPQSGIEHSGRHEYAERERNGDRKHQLHEQPSDAKEKNDRGAWAKNDEQENERRTVRRRRIEENQRGDRDRVRNQTDWR